MHLAEDVLAAFVGLGQGGLHDFGRDAFDLDVHLEGGHAFGGTGHLEVHVAEMVFVTENVGEDGELVAFLDEAHGHAGDVVLERNAGVEHGEAAAADGGHRGGAVGFGDFRNDADRVLEFLGGRENGLQGALGETAVADFAWRFGLPDAAVSPVANGGML